MKKKIRPSHKYTYLTFLILFAALAFLFWAIFGTKPWSMEYTSYIKDRLWIELTYIGAAFLVCFIGALIYVLKVYYLVDNKMIVRMGSKRREFFFNDIVYLDNEYTSKHNDMLLYINTGKWIHLTMDHKKELLEIVKKKCHLLSKDDFILKYPDAYNKK